MFKKILIGLLLSQACWQPVGWLAEAPVLPGTPFDWSARIEHVAGDGHRGLRGDSGG